VAAEFFKVMEPDDIKPESALDTVILNQLKMLIQKHTSNEDELELEQINLDNNEILFEQGADSDCMFWILSGQLEVSTTQGDDSKQIIKILTPDSPVGEMGLLSHLPRTATITALEKSQLLRITINDIIKFSTLDENFLIRLNKLAASRWHNLFLANCLKKLFGDLPVDALQELQDQLEWIDISNGDTLFQEGDEADGVYIIISGRLRAKTIYAVRHSSVVKMNLALLNRYIYTDPTLMRKIAHSVITRQKQLLHPKKRTAVKQLTFTLIRHGQTTAIHDLANSLASLIEDNGNTLVMDSQNFDDFFGQQGIAQSPIDTPIQPVIAARLSELEHRYKFILLIADKENSPWTERAIGQSDRVLIIADSDADPGISVIEETLENQVTHIRRDLVLLHPVETESPSGTAAWLEPRNVSTHYHLRKGDPTHLARLARRLTGRAVGLICSGGGARGYAQLGTYKAILELDIPIDYIAGTSMGAISAGTMACGYSYEKGKELAKYCTDLGVTDLTLPLASIAASKNVSQICQHIYGSRLIEDLWTPFFCISSNLTKAERVVHQRGSLWRAVRASMSIPGVFLPIVEDGDVLVDGGVMDNYPVQLMQDIAESTRLIGVNVNPYIERSVTFDYDTSLSGWRILFSRLNPFSRKLHAPSIMGTILRSLDVNSMKMTKEIASLLELNITPDIRRFTMNDYAKWKAISQCGYDESYDLLKEWKDKQTDI
jgi:predicted acylesterase/phospholipase RssA/CRP-like cAMP-binding protein